MPYRILNRIGVYDNGFADDCVALIGVSNTEQMMSRMQKIQTPLNAGFQYSNKFAENHLNIIFDDDEQLMTLMNTTNLLH